MKGGMLDSQVDSQAWLEAQSRDSRKDSPECNDERSSDVEFMDEPAPKKVKLDHVACIHECVDRLASDLGEAREEKERLQLELTAAREELAVARADILHLQKLMLSVGERMIDHGPGRGVKCQCFPK